MGRIPIRALAATAASVVVVAVPPSPHAGAQLARSLGGTAPDLDAVVEVLAGAGLWLLAVWVLVALTAGKVAALPGAAGAAGRFLVRVCVPRALRGVVLGGLAGGLLLGPAVAATAAPGPAWPTTPAAVAVTTPGPAWPTTAPPTAPTAPTGDAPGSPADPTSPPTTPAPPTTTPPTSSGPGAVVVAPGDSLWSIASDALSRSGESAPPAKVAAAWPAWYAANRAAIGPDPGLLHPGTHLTAPTTDGSTP